MRFLHKDAEYDYSLIYICRSFDRKKYENQFLLRGITATKALPCREFSIIKTCLEIKSLH